MKRHIAILAAAALVSLSAFAQTEFTTPTATSATLISTNPTLDLAQAWAELLALKTTGGVRDVAPMIAVKAGVLTSTNTTLTVPQKNAIYNLVGNAYLEGIGDKTRAATWYGYVLSNSTTANAAYKEVRRKAKFQQGVATGMSNTSTSRAAAVVLLDAAFKMAKTDETTLSAIDWQIAKWWGKYANGGTWTGTASAAILETNLVLNATATNFATDYPRNEVLCEVITGKFKDATTGAWSITGTAATTNANVYLTEHAFDTNTLNTATYALEGRLLQAAGDTAGARDKYLAAFTTLATSAGDTTDALALLAELNETDLFIDHQEWIAWLKTIKAAVTDNDTNAAVLAALDRRLGVEK